MKDSGRRWLIAAVGLFVFLLVGWVLLALQLNSALAGPLPFGPGLMSKMSADYRADEGGRSVMLISLSVMNEALNDAMQTLGLTEEEAAAAHESVELAMSQPVPTATAMDFHGAAPFTATPTVTNTPLPADTPTPTNTRRPPIATQEPTKTPKPTKTSGPSPTAEPTVDDDVAPVTLLESDVQPSPGSLPGCSVTFSLEDVHVTDSAPSSGIDFVGFKYLIPGYVDELTLGPEFDKDDGGWDGDAWDATYSGTLTLEVYPGWLGPDTGDTINIQMWVKAIDNQGHYDVLWLGNYYIADECDDAATPTATPSRTPTASPTSSPTPTPTA